MKELVVKDEDRSNSQSSVKEDRDEDSAPLNNQMFSLKKKKKKSDVFN